MSRRHNATEPGDIAAQPASVSVLKDDKKNTALVKIITAQNIYLYGQYVYILKNQKHKTD